MAADVAPPRLRRLRHGIDAIDDAMLLLWAGRRRLVTAAAGAKRRAGVEVEDPAREHAVRMRAGRLARRLGLSMPRTEGLLTLLIDDARELQGLATDAERGDRHRFRNCEEHPMMLRPPSAAAGAWLRLLPPPRRWAPLAVLAQRMTPVALLAHALDSVLAAPRREGGFAAIDGRRIGIDVVDLRLAVTVCVAGERFEVEHGLQAAEACVHGSATDLLLLAARLEDADTLFFHRRLQLTGDIELGLTARNLLDQLPWDALPLAARIVLHRAAALARAAREVHAG